MSHIYLCLSFQRLVGVFKTAYHCAGMISEVRGSVLGDRFVSLSSPAMQISDLDGF